MAVIGTAQQVAAWRWWIWADDAWMLDAGLVSEVGHNNARVGVSAEGESATGH